MKTWIAKPDEIERKWWIVDADGQTVGRLATQIATALTGKNKPTFTPHVDTGDFVVVINTKKMRFTGNKWDTKKYFRHTGYIGHLRETAVKDQRDKDSTFIINNAVKGMLPKSKLGTTMLTKLKAYEGADHPHAAQKPQTMSV